MRANGFTFWLLAATATIAAGVIVPYGVLGGVPEGEAPSLGIFLFWCAFGVAVVALIAVGVARWRL